MMERNSDTESGVSPIGRRQYLKTTGAVSGLALTGLGSVASAPAAAATSQQFTLDTEIEVEPSSYANFNNAPYDQQRIITYGDYQYIPYWNDDERLALCRRNLTDNSLQNIYFDYTLSSNDSHRTIVVGISDNDGRLHLSYDHHDDEMNWRHSSAGYVTSPPSTISTNDFSATKTMSSNFDESSISYPRFFNDDTGTLYCVYRKGGSGDGDTFLQKHDASDNSWTRVGMTHSSDGTYPGWGNGPGSGSRNAYCHDWTFDPNGRLHVTWCWRESSSTWASNHDICYAYSDDYGVTWKNNAGSQIADLSADDPIDINDDGHVAVSVPTDYWLMNQGTQVLDSNNNPHVFTFRSTVQTSDESQRELHYVHYWRDTSGTWHEDFIDDTSVRLEDKDIESTKEDEFSAPILNRDDVFVDANDNVHIYTAVDHRLYGMVATAANNYGDWTIYALDSDWIIGFDGRKLDDRRWERDGIASVPMEDQNSSGGRRMIVRDYTFASTSSPDAPSLSIKDTTTSQVELSWTEAERTSSYNVHRRKVGGTFSEIASGVAAPSFYTSYTDTNVSSDNTYEYKVEAVNSAGSTDSNIVQAYTAPTASVDSFTENETASPDAEFVVDWSAADTDNDLDTVDVTVTNTTDNTTIGSTSHDVSGSSASGSDTFQDSHADGEGDSYEAEVVATDATGRTGSDTATLTES